MHWTTLLVRRTFPLHAVVIDDVHCAGCGYNLRGARAMGRCPECGREVVASLYLLTKPQVVAGALRGLAWGELGLLAAVLPIAARLLGAAGLVWIGLALLIAGSVYRLVSAGELRFRAGLESLPVIGARLRLVWWLALLEPLLLVGVGGLHYAGQLAAGPPASLVPAATMLWLAVVVASVLVVGGLGSALGGLLGYRTIERDMLIQRVMIVGPPLLALLPLLASSFLAGSPVVAGRFRLAAAAVLALGSLAAVLCTVAGLLHLAAAAERERDLRADALEEIPELAGPDRAPAPEPLPEIELEGGGAETDTGSSA